MSAFRETWLGASGTTPRSKTLRGTSTWLKNMFRPYDYRKHGVCFHGDDKGKTWVAFTNICTECGPFAEHDVLLPATVAKCFFFTRNTLFCVCLCVCSLWVRQNEPGQHNGARFVSVQNWPADVEARVAIIPVRIDLSFRKRFFKYFKIPLSLLVRFALDLNISIPVTICYLG